jgi:hypothetical protein
MEFTNKVYLYTKENHAKVDKHPFIELIKNNKKAGDIYIDFNKICIDRIQKNIDKIITDEYLVKKLKRNCDTDNYLSSDALNKLLIKCDEFCLENAYLFFLGLLAGGNILKKYIDTRHHDFLTFENSKETSKEFKQYLSDKDIDESHFINTVNEMYIIIKEVFDDFQKQYSKL